MKLVTISAVALILGGCAFGSPTVRDVVIVEYGLFEKKESGGTSRDEAAPAKKAEMGAEAKLIEQTTQIPAVLGTSFGVRVRFIGGQAGKPIPCIAKCLHPKITDPASGRTSEADQWEDAGMIGRPGFVGYRFENAWELVPGDWTIQIFVGGKLRTEKTFVVKTAASEEPSPSTTG